MQYRKFQALKIFNGFTWSEGNKVLITEENGTIKDIVSREEAGEGIEELNGFLVPGLINCHCHLELSHLKNIIPPGTGLVSFLQAIIKNRNASFSAKEIFNAMAVAENEIYDNGTAAVADIANTAGGIVVKNKSLLRWYNLIEILNLHDKNLENRLEHYRAILQLHKTGLNKETSTVLTPHAPYSVSTGTLKTINGLTQNSIISIHNQEAIAEDELFKTGNGEFLKLFKTLGEEHSPFKITGNTSIQTWLPNFTNGQTILLVHNTYTSEEDVVFAKHHAKKYNLNLVYCLCPNANLYIENALPPVDLLLKHKCKIVIGTDSYSNNWQLNVAAEIKTLKDHFADIPLETILQWATSNGAQALQFSSLGSFEKGKTPGIVLLKTNASDKENITGHSERIL
jgi:cytosine/adenosine deaminase-related metal-dependent hydrolase